MEGSGWARPVLTQLLDGLRTRSGGLAGRGGPLGAEGYARGRRLGPRLLPSSKVRDGRGGGRESFGRKHSVWGVGLEEEVH